MTLLLNCQELSKTIGPRSLFSGLSLTMRKGDRLGIIGANGSGKTTLLRILCGLDTPDSGQLTLGGPVRTGYLPQDDQLPEQATAIQVLLNSFQDPRFEDAEKYSRAQAMLSRAEFENFETRVHALSGGWRKRLAICAALVREPDLLVMDEPTNHLDLEGILWLEKLISSSFPGCPAAVVMVSHDRLFLENTATSIMELSRLYPEGCLRVAGNYSEFLRRKELFLSQQLEQEERLANKVRRESEWLARGPKARTTKAKYRIDEAQRLQEEFARVRARNRTAREVAIDFDGTGRKTKKLLEASKISKGYGGSPLFAGLDLVLTPGQRLGLLGKNGSGKSTLMQILADAGRSGGATPDSGTIRLAEGVRTVYFAQDRRTLNLAATLRQELSPEGDSVLYRDQSLHVVTWAQKFLFRPDQLDTPVGNLSGGEQARILIAGLMRQPADILLLDEPTNDLDIPSLQVLEESLLDFPGALVLVTHDRYLLNRVCNRVLGFVGEGRASFFAGFDQWRAALQPQQPRIEKIAVQETVREKKKSSGRLSYLDQREYDGMEEAISRAEEEERRLHEAMNQPDIAADPLQAQECWQGLEAVRQEIDRLYRRWEELEVKKGGSG
ncbi:MAG: ABC-F family ATP-binding cassette domain-containing protein [Desulfobulbaceae bacterium]